MANAAKRWYLGCTKEMNPDYIAAQVLTRFQSEVQPVQARPDFVKIVEEKRAIIRAV
jgi:hypothetical protein